MYFLAIFCYACPLIIAAQCSHCNLFKRYISCKAVRSIQEKLHTNLLTEINTNASESENNCID